MLYFYNSSIFTWADKHFAKTDLTDGEDLATDASDILVHGEEMISDLYDWQCCENQSKMESTVHV